MIAWSRGQRGRGKSIGLVPTMGALHDGHLSLIRIAREHADAVIVSLFVNPIQFGPNEDLEKYPRNEERDRMLCEREGADVLFAPDSSVMFSEDASVRVTESALTPTLCGATRPGHFEGVTTIVSKLFNMTDPDVAVFGEKDAQQLRVIRRLVRDMNYAIRIVPGPIVREPDGLAMSSRNALLNEEERGQAACLKASLDAARKMFLNGERDAGVLKRCVADVLAGASLGRVDYIELTDDETMKPVAQVRGRALLAIAVRFSATRLIDNVVLDEADGD